MPGYFVVRIDVTPVIAGPTLGEVQAYQDEMIAREPQTNALLVQIQANGTRRVAAANIPADPTV